MLPAASLLGSLSMVLKRVRPFAEMLDHQTSSFEILEMVVSAVMQVNRLTGYQVSRLVAPPHHQLPGRRLVQTSQLLQKGVCSLRCHSK